MTAVDWARVRPILQNALELPAGEREPYLDRACAADGALREQVGRILFEELAEDGFLRPVVHSAGDADVDSAQADGWAPAAGATLGPYRLRERIGTGGMGAVWLAERASADFRQRVAIKVIKRGMDTDEVLRRFRHERKVLAELEHAGIPRLIDGGATPDGRPYLVMEHVEGTPLDVHARELELDARLALFLKVCEAVQHAHERGVVHRDLKPSNILVTGEGDPKLLDFGISKVLEPGEGFGTVDLTLTGQQMLTPRYASPEQVRGQRVTAAADVYALGLLLWELLVGRPALELDALTSADLEEAVCERAVPRPSLAVEPAQTALKRALAGDLDTICLMALRKEPARRYASVRQLASDLSRHVDGHPVLARPDTMTYRVSKFVRRNRVLVGGVAATFVVLLIGLAGTLIQYRSAREAAAESQRTAYAASLHAAESALRDGQAGVARERLEAAPAELRGWEWEHLATRLDRSTDRFPSNRGWGPARVAWFDDGRTLVHSDHDLVVRSGERELFSREACRPTGIVAEPGGHRLAWCDQSGALWVVDVERGEPSARCLIEGDGDFDSPPRGLDVAWSPDARRLAFSTSDGAVRIFDTASWELQHHFREHGPSELAGRLRWHPDGRRLASGGWDETVQLYDSHTGASLGGWRAHGMCVEDIDFSPDGRLLLTASLDRTLKVWELETRTQLAILRSHSAPVKAARFLPDGERIVSAGDNAVHVTNWRTERVEARLLGHTEIVTDLALEAVSGRLASAAGSNDVRVWAPDTQDVRHFQTCEYARSAHPSPDGERIVTATPDGYARVWRALDLGLELELTRGKARLTGAVWSADGAHIVTGDQEGTLAVWSAVTGELEQILEHPGAFVSGLSFEPQGAELWAAFDLPAEGRSLVRSWSFPAFTPDRVIELPTSHHGFGSFAFGERGDLLVVSPVAAGTYDLDGSEDGASPVLIGDPTVTAGAGLLILADADELQVLDQESRVPLAAWPVSSLPRGLAVHPDGSRLAVSQDELIEIWDPHIALRVAVLHGHVAYVSDLEWSADGATLISTGADGLVFLWETY